jgi:hypothetical protein
MQAKLKAAMHVDAPAEPPRAREVLADAQQQLQQLMAAHAARYPWPPERLDSIVAAPGPVEVPVAVHNVPEDALPSPGMPPALDGADVPAAFSALAPAHAAADTPESAHAAGAAHCEHDSGQHAGALGGADALAQAVCFTEAAENAANASVAADASIGIEQHVAEPAAPSAERTELQIAEAAHAEERAQLIGEEQAMVAACAGLLEEVSQIVGQALGRLRRCDAAGIQNLTPNSSEDEVRILGCCLSRRQRSENCASECCAKSLAEVL